MIDIDTKSCQIKDWKVYVIVGIITVTDENVVLKLKSGQHINSVSGYKPIVVLCFASVNRLF